jgi:hypothetical protein
MNQRSLHWNDMPAQTLMAWFAAMCALTLLRIYMMASCHRIVL